MLSLTRLQNARRISWLRCNSSSNSGNISQGLEKTVDHDLPTFMTPSPLIHFELIPECWDTHTSFLFARKQEL